MTHSVTSKNTDRTKSIRSAMTSAAAALLLAAGAARAADYTPGPWLPITNITTSAQGNPVALQWDDFSNLAGVQLYASDSLEPGLVNWQPVDGTSLGLAPLPGTLDIYPLSVLGTVFNANSDRMFFRLRGVRGAATAGTTFPPGIGGGGGTDPDGRTYVTVPGPDGQGGTCDDVKVKPAGPGDVSSGTGIVTVPPGAAVTTNNVPVIIGDPVNDTVPEGSLVLPDGTVIIPSAPGGDTPRINGDGTVTVGAGDIIALPPYDAPYVVPAPGGTYDPSIPGVVLDTDPPETATLPPVAVVYDAAGDLGAATSGWAFSASVATATAGSLTITYAVQSGALPSGLTLNADGTVTGTPGDTPGVFEVTVRATAVNGLFADAVWTLALAASYPQDLAVTWSGVDQTVMIDLSANYAVTNLPADYAVASDPLSKTTHLYLRRVKAGAFQMGSPPTECAYQPIAAQKSVTLTQAYYIGVYEVTAYQYAFVNAGTTGGAATPQANVSWNAIRGGAAVNVAAAGWMKILTDKVKANSANAGKLIAFDLPTEAQWEYACRAGTAGTYSDSDAIATTQTEADARMNPLGWWSGNSGSAAHEVGTKPANAAGLYDVHGNVYEWTLDAWETSAGLIGGSNPLSTSGSLRVVRGGGWNYDARLCRSAVRNGGTPGESYTGIGFRLAGAAVQ